MSLRVRGTVLSLEGKDWEMGTAGTSSYRSGTSYTAMIGEGADIERVKIPEKMLAEFPGEGNEVEVRVVPSLHENPGNLLQPFRFSLRAVEVTEGATQAKPARRGKAA